MRSFLVFTLAGPLVGAIPFAILFLALGAFDPAGPLLGLAPIIFAYPFGLVPAAIAGAAFVAASAQRHIRARMHVKGIAFVLGAICGLAGCAPVAAFLLASGPPLTVQSFFVFTFFFALPACLAGGVCALLAVNNGARLQRLRRWLLSVWERWQEKLLFAVVLIAALVLVRSIIAA